MFARPDARDARRAEETSPAPAILAAIGPARGHALAIGILSVTCATAVSDEERAEVAAALKIVRQRYCDAIAATASAGAGYVDTGRIARERAIVHGFAARMRKMDDGAAGLTRAEAVEIAETARLAVLPAIARIILLVEERQDEERAARLARMTERAERVGGLLKDMARIGRMIGLISINASVEAARAGGESGRAFQVIAEEVRSLARQSADLLARMKERIDDVEDGPRAG